MKAMRLLSRSEVRSIDERAIRDYGMSGLVLMENAGRGAAEKLFELFGPAEMIILAGIGNNGGDGFVIARHWELLTGLKPEVWIASRHEHFLDGMTSDARTNYEILVRSGFLLKHLQRISMAEINRLAEARIILDALVGTGSNGALRAPTAELVELVNQSNATRIAIDIPSGLDCDYGLAFGPCFRADHTLTFVASKLGFKNVDALQFTGRIHVLGIGVPAVLLEEFVDDA
jgi:NAD(P)H-hydrate epimerase